MLILNFAMDEIKEPRPHGKWSDQQRCTFGLVCVSGQIVEEIDDIICYPMVAREQTDISIKAGGLYVVITGANVHVAA